MTKCKVQSMLNFSPGLLNLCDGNKKASATSGTSSVLCRHKNFPLKHALDKSRTVSSKHMQALGKHCLFWWWLLKYAVVKLIKSRSKAKPWQTTMPEEWRYDHPLFQSLQCWEKASKSLIIIMMMMDKKTNDGRWQHATPMGSSSRVDHVNPQSRPHQHSFGYTSP